MIDPGRMRGLMTDCQTVHAVSRVFLLYASSMCLIGSSMIATRRRRPDIEPLMPRAMMPPRSPASATVQSVTPPVPGRFARSS